MRLTQRQILLYTLTTACCLWDSVVSFTAPQLARSPLSGALRAEEEGSNSSQDINPVTKASWYAVEAFGKVFGRPSEETAVPETPEFDLSQPPSSLRETLQRLAQDNEREYFLSGQVDELLYAVDCTFADPFVSFDGRTRFVDNLQNLGSFITKYSARPLQKTTTQEIEATETMTTVETKFMVKLELNLPWKPVLAWPWGVVCTIDKETFQIVRHEEKWDIEPLAGVKQIFRKPTTSVS